MSELVSCLLLLKLMANFLPKEPLQRLVIKTGGRQTGSWEGRLVCPLSPSHECLLTDSLHGSKLLLDEEHPKVWCFHCSSEKKLQKISNSFISSMQRTLTSSRCPTWSVGDQIHTHINICMYIYICMHIYTCLRNIPMFSQYPRLSPEKQSFPYPVRCV